MVRDLIGERAEKISTETGLPCMDCRALSELVQDIQKALMVNEEELAEAEREHHGLVNKD